jgi:hypothetical protein
MHSDGVSTVRLHVSTLGAKPTEAHEAKRPAPFGGQGNESRKRKAQLRRAASQCRALRVQGSTPV